jgi:RNA polymerase sigma factor (sigma-70 family)
MTRFLQAILASLKADCPQGAAPTPDAILLEAFTQRGDRDALELLVRRHAEAVWRVCKRVLRSHHDAEDAFQATFYILAAKANSIRKGEVLSGWLHRVALRVSLAARHDHLRPWASLAGPTAGDVSAEAREELAILDQEVDRLPAKYRRLIILCYFEGKTNSEAAAALGIADGTVYSRLARARDRLRTKLLRRGVGVGLTAKILEQGPAVAKSVSSELIEQAVRVAAGDPAITAIEFAAVVRLAKGALTAMFLKQCKIAFAVAVLVACVGIGGWRLLPSAPAQAPATREQTTPSPETKADLSTLHRARIDAAAAVFEYEKNMLLSNKSKVAGHVYQWSLKWLEAARDADPRDELPALESHRRRMIELREMAKQKADIGVVAPAYYKTFVFAVAEVDIWIVRAKMKSSESK